MRTNIKAQRTASCKSQRMKVQKRKFLSSIVDQSNRLVQLLQGHGSTFKPSLS